MMRSIRIGFLLSICLTVIVIYYLSNEKISMLHILLAVTSRTSTTNQKFIERQSSSFRAFITRSKLNNLHLNVTEQHTYDDTRRLCSPAVTHENEVTFYKMSKNRLYHYEYRYELSNHSLSSNESRLILLLTGRGRLCIDWWTLSAGETILSHMRSSGFSILTICTTRHDYYSTVPIQRNKDAYWIYTTLQMWMKDVYYKRFQHYPRLYLFGVSRGSETAAILCRVLPVQAQILYIHPGNRPSLLIHSDYDKEIQNRLIADYRFANWFYLDYCFGASETTNKQCPFAHFDKNYFNPVPPTYYIHLKHDTMWQLSTYESIISEMRKDAFELGGTFLTYSNTINLHVASSMNVTPDFMKDNFKPWSCKPRSSRLFYEHFVNPKYRAFRKPQQTCWCAETNFKYFQQRPNLRRTWSKRKQDEYRDYFQDLMRYKIDLCEVVCGDITAKHAMTSHHVGETLTWLDDMDHLRSSYQVEEFLSRPLRLWMYNKHDLVQDADYLIYQTPMATRCARQFQAYQMYSAEFFLQDYFERLNKSHPLPRHNLIWSKDPLLADYYIIPHDCICMRLENYRPNVNISEHKAFCKHLNEHYVVPLLYNIRTLFPFWNMTLGANHIIAVTAGRNMGDFDDPFILHQLEHVIQLGYTGFRQDLMPSDATPLYQFHNMLTVYRHNYDIIIPPFVRLQSMNNRSFPKTSSLDEWYAKKETLLFFAGTVNNSNSTKSPRRHLSLLINEDIGNDKRYQHITTIHTKQLHTMVFNDGIISDTDYVEMIHRSVFHLCLEGYSPWSPRLYESVCLGTIPLVLAESIVLPFERFVDWRSFSIKLNANNTRNIIDIVKKIDHFEDFVKQKLENANRYFHAFRWPYSSVGKNVNDQHEFLPAEDQDGKVKNVFHYISLELRCRRLEQFYGMTSDGLSTKSLNAKRRACQNHPRVCPCYEEQNSLAVEEYV